MDQLKQQLQATGELEAIVSQTKQELRSCGWYDQVNALGVHEASLASDLKFDDLVQNMEQRALAMVPEKVRIELLQKIHNAAGST